MKKQLFIGLIGILVIGLGVPPWFSNAQQDDPLRLKIAFVSNQAGNDDIFTMPADGSRNPTNITRNRARDWNPDWSPDGERIIFNSDRNGRSGIFIMEQDGTRPRALFNVTDADYLAPAWSPEGDRIAFVSNRHGIGWDLYVANADGTNIQRLTTTESIMGDPTWSPDGTEIAYWWRTGGRIDVYKITLATGAILRITVSGENNGAPAWSPDGTQLLYDTDQENQWAIFAVEPNGNRPGRYIPAQGNTGRSDWSADGEYIVFTSDAEDSDELYIIRSDGSELNRLTTNASSDHSPAWQPRAGSVVTVLEAAPDVEPTATPEAADELLAGPAMGQSVELNSVEVRPIRLETLLVDYNFQNWHIAGWTGQNIRVGVIDTDFGRIATFEDTFGVDVQLYQPERRAEFEANRNDHGTDVLEVIHRTAPDAQLYACQYDGFLEGMIECADWMDNNDVRIINHSVGNPSLPLDGTNDWALEVNQAFNRNILWVNSAGNFNRGFFGANFSDIDQDNIHDFTVGSSVDEILRFEDIDPERGYSGNIMLSWEGLRQFNAETSLEQSVDLDIEAFPLADDSVSIGIGGNREQRNDDTAPTYERVYISTNEPFGIRIVNRGLPIMTPVDMALFVEFLAIPQARNDGSVLSPGDAQESLTVGAVKGAAPTIADYSSRGLFSQSNVDKPDIGAPGEFLLSDDQYFIGTSAASPAIAGAAALLWGTDLSQRSYDVRDTILLSTRTDAERNDNLGRGVFIMPPAPAPNLAFEQEIVVEPFTVFPQQEVTFVDTGYRCPGSFPSRLEIGMPGYVNYNLGLSGRTGPGSEFRDLTGIEGLLLGTRFRVIGGPECQAPLSWWEVELEDESRMWVAEGADYPFVSPTNLVDAQIDAFTDISCPFAPPTQFEIGDRAVIQNPPPGGLTIWRSQGFQNVIAGLASGTELHLLGGPLCVEEDKYQWFVRVIDGRWAGNEGWVTEAITGTRWLVGR